MLTPDLLTADQQDTIDRLYENNQTLLVANMGSGKTVVTLSALAELLRDGVCKRILVLAPLKVCNTVWRQEAEAWSHTSHLDIGIATGNEKRRRNVLDADHDITVINFENLAWLWRKYKAKGRFDGLVVDELTKLKEVGGSGFKALRPRLVDFTWRLGMTGTVVSEDWVGLFGQMLVVDSGQRLGTRKDGYLRKFFYPTDYNEYNWELHDWSAKKISDLISDVVYTMPDYRHQLPPLLARHIRLQMPKELRNRYDDLRKSMVLDVDGDEVAAESAAILSNKLLQCANGFIYGPADPISMKKETHFFSDYKIAEAERLIDAWLAAGEQVMVCYWFGADQERLVGMYGGDALLSDAAIERWNSGAQDVLLLHPRSAGHGLNLAKGGCKVLWLGPVWSRDLHEQTNARLWRRGQTKEVEVVTIVADDSIDELVTSRVEEKGEYEALFKQHLGG